MNARVYIGRGIINVKFFMSVFSWTIMGMLTDWSFRPDAGPLIKLHAFIFLVIQPRSGLINRMWHHGVKLWTHSGLISPQIAKDLYFLTSLFLIRGCTRCNSTWCSFNSSFLAMDLQNRIKLCMLLHFCLALRWYVCTLGFRLIVFKLHGNNSRKIFVRTFFLTTTIFVPAIVSESYIRLHRRPSINPNSVMFLSRSPVLMMKKFGIAFVLGWSLKCGLNLCSLLFPHLKKGPGFTIFL